MKRTAKYIGIILVAAVMVSLLVLLLGIQAGAATTESYVDKDGNVQVVSNVTELTGTNTSALTLNSGWYIIRGTYKSGYRITCEGDVHLIIADGAVATTVEINVFYGSSLTIYGQQSQTGTLTATAGGTVIGGYGERGMGDITINGGIINATCTSKVGEQSAAIGATEGAAVNKIGNITINGGTVTAKAVDGTTYGIHHGIGIHSDSENCTITINGGTVIAQSGEYFDTRSWAFGIGGDVKFNGIIINGGDIEVFGDACAIGGNNVPITINGGTIKARTKNDGAAIGSCSSSNAGVITINGGYVEAIAEEANYGECAIGSGSGASNKAIIINGGTVIADATQYGLGSDGGKFDLVITGGSIYSTGGKSPFPTTATFKNASGEAVTLTQVELTLENSGNGVKLTSAAGEGFTYNLKDAETVGGKISLYLENTSVLPTKLHTNNGLYLQKSSGSTTYELHTSHSVEPVYTPNAIDIEKHDKLYTCCDTLTVEEHHFSDGNYTCACGERVSAEVDGELFVSFDNALRAAQADASSTITLHTDVMINDDINVNGNVTLDLNGKALVTSDKYLYAIYLRTGSLTIKDSSENGTGSIIPNSSGVDTIGAESGTLTIESGSLGRVTVDGGTLVINGGSFVKLEAQVNLQTTLEKNLYFYGADGAIVDAAALKVVENVETRLGADLLNSEATLEYTEIAYTNKENKPSVTLTVFGSAVEGENYDVAYKDNILPGTATVTVTGKGIYTGEKTFTFSVLPGELVVVENPSATHEFGDVYSDKEITGGKVVIKGNEDEVVTGKWTWVEGAPRATFTPDEKYEGLFLALTEEYDVNITVTASKPVITISAPTNALTPGVKTVITVEVRNAYDELLSDLPESFRIIYRIGEEGAEITTDGLEFSLTSDAKTGEKVYLVVESVAVDGKYSAEKSVNTLEFTVGQIDYSDDIEDIIAALDELKEAVNNGNSDEELLGKIDNLGEKLENAEKLIEALENDTATNTEVETLKAELERAEAELVATKADLQTRIEENGAAINALNEKPEAKNGASVAAIIIASVSIAANLALGAYLFIFRRRGY